MTEAGLPRLWPPGRQTGLSSGRSAPLVVVKGAGDLASGVALRLHRAGLLVIMTEGRQPTAVRRTVAFAEAVYDGEAVVEGVRAIRADTTEMVAEALAERVVAVVVDPDGLIVKQARPLLVVDAIMAKRNLGTRMTDARAVVALGPGFAAGVDAHAVIETQRGPALGRVLLEGQALPDTGEPGDIAGLTRERLLRAPQAGVFQAERTIGDLVAKGEPVGRVGDAAVRSQVDGVLRGLLRSGLEVPAGFKIGDVDPRARREQCFLVSDKALAVGGGVLEAACALLGGIVFGCEIADALRSHGRTSEI